MPMAGRRTEMETHPDIRTVTLAVQPGIFAISRAAPDAPLPDFGNTHGFLAITRTHDELSIIAPEQVVLEGFTSERGWRCLKVLGPLAFGEIGVLSSIAAPLAAAAISIVAVSTYDTDYVFVRDDAVDRAVEALRAAGHRIAL